MMEVIIAATGGNYSRRVQLHDVEDPLLEVEVGINFLLDELCLRLEETEAKNRALSEQSQQIAAQAETLIAALSTPIIVLWPGVLILPLIGEFGPERAANTMSTLLERVASERASHVVLDLTGVESISPDTIASLLSMVRAMKLLGVTCLLTGIGPRAARQLSDLDISSLELRTLARVGDALSFVLRDKQLTL